MKYAKMLGLLVAAATLMGFAGTASAAIFTSPAGTIYTGTVGAYSFNTQFHGSFISVSCGDSELEFKVETHGASVTAGGKLSTLYFAECNYPVTVKKAGSLEYHPTGSGNATVTSSGAEIAIHTSVGECILTTSKTDIGTHTAGSPAKLDIASAAIPRTGGSFFCGSTSTWTASYTVLPPSFLGAH